MLSPKRKQELGRLYPRGGKYNIHLFLVIFNHRLLKFCTFLSSYIIILDLFLSNGLSENYCFLEVKFHYHIEGRST